MKMIEEPFLYILVIILLGGLLFVMLMGNLNNEIRQSYYEKCIQDSANFASVANEFIETIALFLN
jgi:hypothetical protein